MSIHACNFNSEATLHDPEECEFLLDLDIVGATSVSTGDEEVYTTSGTAGATFTGVFKAGLWSQVSTPNLSQWFGQLAKGLLEVTEVTQAGCEGETFHLEVEADGQRSGMAVGMTFAMYPNPANDQVVIEFSGGIPSSCASKMPQDERCTAWPTSNRATPFPQRTWQMACTKWSS